MLFVRLWHRETSCNRLAPTPTGCRGSSNGAPAAKKAAEDFAEYAMVAAY